ncbi:MAG: hypothetical protein A2287_01190 [Candidatus Melainabacteria bacterium RIFOXYA12_FULL_32_12]|nr:MAG: hypothetical protein A2104_00460 [Candidatus Melainabacteria bacterium GWF2_32_7]OGI16879.1 MAG: hypothetical protein A2255_03985 [Candidatus Melainabacteria bacterium RIFOXYA2_FULL_32_9]OGI26809.1 MAG: hypothetical protein A2287_01190 [Candidatus Melainabacteria bacterium RIFOXYA12_FULL_32_12]
MKKKALEEAKKYEKFILEEKVQSFQYMESDGLRRRPIVEVVRKEIAFKDIEKLIKETPYLVDTYIIEDSRHIKIGIDKLIICRYKTNYKRPE